MESQSIRYPAVSGRFYPEDAEALEQELTRHLAPAPPPDKAEFADPIACLVPHAGYMYSGHVAGAVYRRLPARPSYIVMGPNHFGYGQRLALLSEGAWLTPLGEVPLNPALARLVRDAYPAIAEDAEAHAREHSIEVQLPFLQHGGKTFNLLPISLAVVDYETLEQLGHAVAQAVRRSPEPVLIVASSDLNHYEPDDVTRSLDKKAIDRILDLDPAGLHAAVLRERISMCGVGPAVAMLVAALDLGARRAEMVKYATSADRGGPRDRVVGYAGIVVTR